jgi:ribosomal protein L23
VTIVKLFSSIAEWREKYSKLEKEKEKSDSVKKDLIKIDTGHRVIYPEYGLELTSKDADGKDVKESFKVTYELEVLEVAQNRVKVKAIDFTSVDRIGRDSANKAGIIQFMKDKWVDKNQVQLIVDNSVRRNHKLEQLGIKD